MTITLKPGRIIVQHGATVWEKTPTGYAKNGTPITLQELPMRVRYLMAMNTVGESPL